MTLTRPRCLHTRTLSTAVHRTQNPRASKWDTMQTKVRGKVPAFLLMSLFKSGSACHSLLKAQNWGWWRGLGGDLSGPPEPNKGGKKKLTRLFSGLHRYSIQKSKTHKHDSAWMRCLEHENHQDRNQDHRHGQTALHLEGHGSM